MKTTIRNVVGLLVLIVAAGVSPLDADAQIRYGAAVGLNYTDIDDVDLGSTSATYDSRQGYHIGVFLDVPLVMLGVRAGIFYINSGKIFEDGLSDLINEALEGSDVEVDDDFNVSFITIPIDVRYQMGLAMVQPYLFAGPELRFRTEADIIDEVDDDIKSFGVAANLGLGVELAVFGLTLLPEFRMAFDVSGLMEDEITIGDFEFVADEAHELRTVMLRLGVIF